MAHQYVSIALSCGCTDAVPDDVPIPLPTDPWLCEQHGSVHVVPGDGGVIGRLRAEAREEDDRLPRYHEDRPGDRWRGW